MNLSKTSKKDFLYKTEPWSHQVMALDYLYNRNTAALYTDMGTGKSKVMIDLIVNKNFESVLIVCTKKGCSSWVKQFKTHSDIDNVIDLSELATTKKVIKLQEIYALSGIKVFLCNYDSIWREPFATKLLSKKFKLDCIICDESHRIKTPSSKCSRFLSKLSKKSEHRYLVTGTPLAESPTDIYAQYRFLNPEIFGTSLSRFRDRYENLNVNLSAKLGFRVLDSKVPYINLEELKEKMFSCAFMAKSSIKLPKRLNIIKEFDLSREAQKAYEEMSSEGIFQTESGISEVENALALATRKQQITSGFLPVESLEDKKILHDFPDNRNELFRELLEDLPKNEPVVVFAKFRKDLDNIRQLCKQIHRGYSEISGKYNEEDDWQKGKTQILGVQYTSGSESITLTRAHYCVYYSLTYNLSLYQQSKKRIHRPGQEHTCIYYYLVAKTGKQKSIDRTILDAIKSKQSIIDSIVKDFSKNR